MAHKSEGDCPVATAVFIRKQADKQGLSVNEMINEYSTESGLPKSTLDKWVWPRKPGTAKNGVADKAKKTHTKPEVKTQISEIVKEIKAGAVSDDHAKKLGDALAGAVTDGICDKRVITKAHTAVKKDNAKRKETKSKEIDNYQRLEKHVTAATNGLQLLADGSIPPPETEKELDAATCIKGALPNLCLQTARLGVNLIEINEDFYKGDEDGKKRREGKEAKYIEA